MNDPPSHDRAREPDGTPPAPDESSALEHVVDDLEPKLQAAEWARTLLASGRTPEELASELVANGWDEDDAAGLVEDARQQTRHLRGVITRDDVARSAAAQYRQAMGIRWFAGFPMLSAAWRLMTSLAYVISRRRRPNQGVQDKR